jgi:hypothetical protein
MFSLVVAGNRMSGQLRRRSVSLKEVAFVAFVQFSQLVTVHSTFVNIACEGASVSIKPELMREDCPGVSASVSLLFCYDAKKRLEFNCTIVC